MTSSSRFPSFALWFILAALLATTFAYHHWTRSKPNERGVIKWDVISYYGYLPATFIYGDVTLGFIDDPPEGFVNDSKFWYAKLENGKRLIQTSMGLSILYSPFFFSAHALAPLFGEPRDGYGSIYQFFLVLSTLFYVMVGLLVLRRILLRYFSPAATAITLVLVALGTNLFFYTVHNGPMSHGYNFALITLFLWLIIRWYGKPSAGIAIAMGLLFGLIVLIRPSNIIAGSLFLLWGVDGWQSLQSRFRDLVKHWPQLLLMAFCFLLPWIPQLIYWKAVTGSYLFNSYGPSGSNFYPEAPQFLDLLFSYRKGWYLYTPLMLVATAGLFLPGRWIGKQRLAIGVYLILQIYLLASWWSWWNGGSFGLRSFVDIYGVMAIPLAAAVEYGLGFRRIFRWVFLALLGFFLYLNQFQTWQYNKGVIHYSGMTREAYWLNFLKFRADGRFWHMLEIPDAQLARQGIYVEYDTGADHSALREMEPAEGKRIIREELLKDPALVRQIDRHARRAGITFDQSLEMVTERVYGYRVSS